MSHQGYEGWFPECLVCGMGNLGGIVCLVPDDDGQQHGLTPIRGEASGISELRQDEHGHWWMRCLLCEREALSDPLAWGSVAYCTVCWNHFTTRGLYPPASAARARRMTPEEWGGHPWH